MTSRPSFLERLTFQNVDLVSHENVEETRDRRVLRVLLNDVVISESCFHFRLLLVRISGFERIFGHVPNDVEDLVVRRVRIHFSSLLFRFLVGCGKFLLYFS